MGDEDGFALYDATAARTAAMCFVSYYKSNGNWANSPHLKWKLDVCNIMLVVNRYKLSTVR